MLHCADGSDGEIYGSGEIENSLRIIADCVNEGLLSAKDMAGEKGAKEKRSGLERAC